MRARLSPGASVGTLTFGSGLTLGSGASLDFEVQDPNGLPGLGFDTLVVAGVLSFTSTPGSPFTINLISLDGDGNPGVPLGFNSSLFYSWEIASASNITGFTSSNVALNTSTFFSSLGGGNFSMSATGSNLFLSFTPVPEPSTYVLMIAGLGAVVFPAFRRRWRR